MTAEITILNREAVALAADSAVTYSDHRGQKIFQSANKIFALSKYHPVGIMVYGDALFMEVPWETVIKMYRRTLGGTRFATLSEYSEHFLRFLSEEPRLNRPDVQLDYVRREAAVTLLGIRLEIDRTVKALLEAGESVSDTSTRKLAKRIIRNHAQSWSKLDPPETLPHDIEERVRGLYQKELDELRKQIFKDMATPEAARWLTDIAVAAVCKFSSDRAVDGTSGVVIAGFGEDEVFPSFISCFIDGVIDRHLKYLPHTQETITHDSPVVVQPFAQREMVYMFMEGIDPEYRTAVEVFTLEVLLKYPEEVLKTIPLAPGTDAEDLKQRLRRISRDLFRKYSARLGKYRSETYAQPIVRVMSMLPKEELAAAAESLVNITSVKRRFSLQAETVGGPTDVAVISKGDGFIWIKRKHYFDPRLNPHFTANYFREDTNGE